MESNLTVEGIKELRDNYQNHHLIMTECCEIRPDFIYLCIYSFKQLNFTVLAR